MIQALLLDADDTLFDTGSAMLRSGSGVAAELWPHAGPVVWDGFARRFRDDPEGEFGSYTRGEISFAEMRSRRFAASTAAYGLALDAGLRDRFEEAYHPRFRTALRAYDDVLPLLEWAGAVGLPVGVLTNSSDPATAAKLAAVGLAERLPGAVVTRDTLGFGKPDARVFEHACDVLGVGVSGTLYVGDDPVVDAGGSYAAGLWAALLDRSATTSAWAGRRATIASLAVVPDLVSGATAGEWSPGQDLGRRTGHR